MTRFGCRRRLIFVPALDPGLGIGEATLIAAAGRAVEHLIGDIESLYTAQVTGIGVIHQAIFEDEGAQPHARRYCRSGSIGFRN